MKATSRFAGEVAWALVGVPITVTCVVILVVLLPLGALLSPLFAGVLLFAGALVLARKLGSAHRRLARSLLGLSVPEPAAPRLAPGLWNWIKGRATGPVAWRALAFLVLRLPMSMAELAVTTALPRYGFGTLIYPLAWPFTRGRALPWFDIHTAHWVESVPLALAGGILLLLTPRTGSRAWPSGSARWMAGCASTARPTAQAWSPCTFRSGVAAVFPVRRDDLCGGAAGRPG